MRAYGPYHVLWLLGIAILAAALSVVCRRELVPKMLVRVALACLILGGELQRFFHDGMQFPDRLPLHLCNIAALVAVVACLTLAPLAVEFVYFLGLAGAGVAMLTPDMGAHWPPRFFVNHGAVMVTAITLVFGRIAPLRLGAIWRAYGMGLVYLALIGIFDGIFRVNYFFLCRKPDMTSVLDVLGPWPVYIVWALLVALGLFGLLWLPARLTGKDGPEGDRAPVTRPATHPSAFDRAADTRPTMRPQS